MYRSRLGSDLDDATLGYVSSIGDDQRIMLYDIVGSQAHVLMLLRQDVISGSDARKILAALESLKTEDLDGASGSEDIHELIESEVIKKAGLASGGRMHTARSRNDQVVLDMRMKIRDDIITICGCLLDAAESAVSVAASHQRTVMPLYTHMQQAQAGLFSHYLLAHADALLRDFERIFGMLHRVNQSPLGAGPVGGTSIPIDREYTARMLGFEGVLENSIDATGARDFAAEYAAMLCIMMTNLSRISEDLVVWSTSEFSFVELADEFSSPSSVMPQKKNPDILELTRGKAADAIGGLVSILAAAKGLASGYGRDLQQIKPSVWAASDASIGALVIFKSMLLTIKVDRKRMKKAAESGNLVALDIAEKLVMHGVPFRVTHRIAGILTQIAHESKKSISRLGMPDAERSVAGTGVDPGLVHDVISSTSIVSSLRDRKSRGSSGYGEQRRMIADRTARIGALRDAVMEQQNRIATAAEDLQSQVDDLIR